MNQNESNHRKVKRIFKILGIILTIIGFAFAITGFASFFIAMNNATTPKLFWCCFVGFPILVVGLWMLMFGFRKEIMQYATCPACGEQVSHDALFCKKCGKKL